MSGILGGAPKPVANQTVTNNPPDYAIPKLTDISNLAQQAYQQFIANGYNQPYSGQRSAGQNPFDTLSMNTGQAGADQFLASGAPQNTMDLSKYYNNKVISGGYDPTKAIEAYARPITENFTNSIAPRLTSSAITSGAYGGSKAQEFNNRAVKDLNSTLADTASRTQLAYDQAEKGAAGMVPMLANQSLQQTGAAADVYGNIANTQRGFTQQDINDQINKWNELTQSPFAGLGQYAGLVQGAAGNYGSQTTPIMSQGGSPFGSILGQGLGGFLGAGGMSMLPAATTLGMNAGLPASMITALSFLSDKRVKENIKFEKIEKGHRLYSFNYIWDKGQRFLGVLAQDILEYAPGAVGKIGDILVVKYYALGIEMRRV